MLVSRSVKFPFHCICQRTVLNNRKCENETYTWKMVLRVLQLLYWITAVCSVLPSACTVHHVSSKTHACLSRTGAHVSVREVRSPDDVTGFKVVTDWVRSNLIKMCWFEMWLLVALPPHRRRHLMLLHLKPNVFIAAAAFTWSSCLSLTAGVSFLLLHFVPVLFTFCWILPSADTVLCLCAVFDPQCQMLTELRGSQCTLSSELRHCLSWMSSCAGQRWWCYLDEKRLMAIDSYKQSLLHTSVKGPLHPKSHKPLSSNALRWNIMAQCIVFLYHANKVILSKEV